MRELDDLNSQFEFLVSDNPRQLDGNEILRQIQYFDQLTREMEKADVFPSDVEYQVDYRRLVAKTRQTWSPRHE